MILPANREATAAIKNDNIIEGPAKCRATEPTSTYTPTPSVLPTPSAVRSHIVRHLHNKD